MHTIGLLLIRLGLGANQTCVVIDFSSSEWVGTSFSAVQVNQLSSHGFESRQVLDIFL